MWALFYFIPLAVLGHECKDGWSYFNEFCYRHFYNVNDRVNVVEAGQRCVSQGGHLAPIYDDATVTFLGNLTKMPGNSWYEWLDQAVIGIRRDAITESGWYNEFERSKSPPFHKFQYPFGNQVWDKCVLLNVDRTYKGDSWQWIEAPPAPRLIPTICERKFSRYICRMEKKEVECKTPHAEKVDGKCVCEKGYVDIADSKDPEARKYKKGEKCIPVVAQPSKCAEGWTYFNEFCYKHFYNANDRVNVAEAGQRCTQHGAMLTPVFDDATVAFLGNLTKFPGYGWFEWLDQAVVGIRRDAITKTGWYNEFDRSKSPPFHKLDYPFGDQVWDKCVLLNVDRTYKGDSGQWIEAPAAPRLVPTICERTFNRYICRREKKAVVCNKPHTENVNDNCVCKKGYIDITETDVPERKRYQKGDKCIPKDPCREVEDLTVNFIVDSSESIGTKNWDSLVEFLRSGAVFLPNTARVGFVKYSDNVTFSNALPAGWTEKKFRSFVPIEYDKAGTNTPEALDEARKMFGKDSNKNKVAILITDGLPFVDGLDEVEVLKKTEQAAEKLRSKNIHLIALGYGESLYASSGYKKIQKWLEDPEEDYFGYDKLACDFKQMHMSILMQKVCRRFVKDSSENTKE